MATEHEVVNQHEHEHEHEHEHAHAEFVSTSSFRIITTIDEHSSGVAEDQIEITPTYTNEESESESVVDNMSALRDTSNTITYFELNDTRESVPGRKSVTVNTHDSILDLESQGGDDDTSFCDDDDDDMMGIINLSSDSNSNSFLGKTRDEPKTKSKTKSKKKVRSVSPIHSTNNKVEATKPMKVSEEDDQESGIMSMTLYSVTDTFVDSLCTSTACVVSDNYYMHTNRSYKKDKSAFDSMDNKIGKFQQSCQSGWFDSEPANDSKESEQSSKAMVSMDIWRLLGCSTSPGESELEEIWSLRTPPEVLKIGKHSESQKATKQPVRASIRKRMKRIHRLRMDDRRISGASRHGVTITNHCIDSSYHTLNNIRNDIHMNKNSNANYPDNDTSFEGHQFREPQLFQPSYRAIDKSYSMLDDPLEEFIGKGLVDPIPVQVEDGYDSDPGVNCYSVSSSMITDSPSSSQPDRMEEDSAFVSVHVPFPLPSDAPQHHDDLLVDPIPTNETEMRESVQQTLNSTWTLTWHPNAQNRKEYNIPHSKPICINMWLERGAVMTNSGVVVEPAFMWSDAYQPLLLSQHKLNTSSQKPWSMRLLNACRITPYFSSPNDGATRNSLDRSKYPLARKNASFLLKSCGGEEFLLEAKSSEDAIAITERWKLVVARFACLAVTEDVGGIAREFFHPTSDSKMLTVPDPNNVF